jgi:Zinc carboxypeptidase/Cytosolic carboxypeptidase N-terminal domain
MHYHEPMLMLLALAASIHSDFEGGRVGSFEWTSPAHVRIGVAGEKDQDGRNRQANWFFFRIDGAAAEITVDLVDLPGEYNYRPNRGAITADTWPWISSDLKRWRQVENAEYHPAEPQLRFRVRPGPVPLWVAHVPPYTNRDLAALLRQAGPGPYLRQSTIGKSVEGRDLFLLTITAPGPESGRKVVWLMTRQHSWEAGTSWAAEGLIRFLVSADPRAARIRGETVFKILPLCDPDGVARGGVRFNKFGFDLNRNWDRDDPVRMPEIAAQRKAVFQWLDSGRRIDLFLSLHNTETGEYLAGPPDPEGRHRELLGKLARLLEEKTSFQPTRAAWSEVEERTPGRMNVVQGLWHDRKIPAFLTEQRISKHPKLGHAPGVEDRLTYGAALAQVLFEAVR